MFYKDDKLALMIDGASLHSTAKALGFDIDYKLLRQEFAQRGRLLRSHYYALTSEGEEYNPVKPLMDWLDYNGYKTTSKTVREFTDPSGRRKIKGTINVEMVVDALELAGKIDHLVLFTGDGEFRAAIEGIQRKGTRVTVVSTLKSSPPMASDDLRRQADAFIDLEEIRHLIERPRNEEQRA